MVFDKFNNNNNNNGGFLLGAQSSKELKAHKQKRQTNYICESRKA